MQEFPKFVPSHALLLSLFGVILEEVPVHTSVGLHESVFSEARRLSKEDTAFPRRQTGSSWQQTNMSRTAAVYRSRDSGIIAY